MIFPRDARDSSQNLMLMNNETSLPFRCESSCVNVVMSFVFRVRWNTSKWAFRSGGKHLLPTLRTESSSTAILVSSVRCLPALRSSTRTTSTHCLTKKSRLSSSTCPSATDATCSTNRTNTPWWRHSPLPTSSDARCVVPSTCTNRAVTMWFVPIRRAPRRFVGSVRSRSEGPSLTSLLVINWGKLSNFIPFSSFELSSRVHGLRANPSIRSTDSRRQLRCPLDLLPLCLSHCPLLHPCSHPLLGSCQPCLRRLPERTWPSRVPGPHWHLGYYIPKRHWDSDRNRYQCSYGDWIDSLRLSTDCSLSRICGDSDSSVWIVRGSSQFCFVSDEMGGTTVQVVVNDWTVRNVNFRIGPYGTLLNDARRERQDAIIKLEENQDDFENAISI